MKLKDFELLKKLMNTTVSENDGEALNAIRMANNVLKRNAVDWDRVFARLVTIDIESAEEAGATPPPPTKTSTADAERRAVIEKMFSTILDDVKEGSFRTFILDVQAKFRQYGSLTHGQYEAVSKSYNRIMNR